MQTKKNNKKDLSIIITTRNSAASLEETLDSLIAQKEVLGINFEIIVVDQNSDDTTSKVIHEHMPRSGFKVKYILEERKGRSLALNKAVEEAKGEVIAFTDDDVILDPYWLGNIYKMFQDKKDVLLVSGRIARQDNNLACPNWIPKNKFDAVFGITELGDTERFLKANEYIPNNMNIYARKSLFEMVGYFDPIYISSQDREFFMRVKTRGVNIYYAPQIVTYHKISQDRLSKQHFIKFFYKAGQANAKCKEEYLESKKKIFNIPSWILKEFVFKWFDWIHFALLGRNERKFSCELDIHYLKGAIRGILNQGQKIG